MGERVFVGQLSPDVTMGCRVDVYVTIDENTGSLHIERAPVTKCAFRDEPDHPYTVVTREGLLRLAQGPFSEGFVEDHL